MDPAVKIKGIKEGLLITTGEGEWDLLERELLNHLDQQADFLRGARLALDVGNHVLQAVEMVRLRDQISDRGLCLWCVISDSPRTRETAQTVGLATRVTRPAPEQTIPTLVTSDSGEQAVLVRRTLCSGHSLSHPGHIVIIGDVNPGAEIIAGGDVVVWGRLRGMVHAGADGNEKSVICALEMSPTQLRIADQIAPLPNRLGKSQPQIAHLHNGEVQAELWNPKGK